ncbi:MAG: hypothetical protein INR73_24120 [Williamsia sp.]|nr:hypothetical protein [Williamsia sp.]
MFTSFRALAAVLACLLVFSSCQKEYSDTIAGPGGSAGATGVFKAKIDGVQYTADIGATGSMLLGSVAILAYSKEKKFFAIQITDTVSGTYVFSHSSGHAMVLVDSTDANKDAFSTTQGTDPGQVGGSVTITIDKAKKMISGTFSGKLFRDSDGKQKQITEGSFQVPYTSTVSAAKSTDTFRVKIDGADWSAKSINAVTSGGLLSIIASEQNLTKVVSIQLPQAVTAGTYDLDIATDYAGLYLPDGLTAYTASPGKVTVLERNTSSKRIRGNFEFKAVLLTNSATFLQMTEGYFSVGY